MDFAALRRILTLLLLLGVLIIGSSVAYYRYQLQTVPSLSSRIEHSFVITEGMSAQAVARSLQDEGFILSSWAFNRYIRSLEADTSLQPGTYFLPRSLTIPELTSQLIDSAPQEEVRVTIPEGSTLSQIDAILVRSNLTTPGDFLRCVERECDFVDFPFLPEDVDLREGFFFPDTYFVSPTDFTVQGFASRLLQNFDTRTRSLLNAPGVNGWDTLRMASIIEREATRDTTEQAIIAGILWKRLENDWRLDADATTRYALDKWGSDQELTVSDLQDPSAWNTRRNRGLPPGPISNPGMDSLRASADPTETPYWFYLHDPTGRIHYSETLEEHNEKKALYLQ